MTHWQRTAFDPKVWNKSAVCVFNSNSAKVLAREVTAVEFECPCLQVLYMLTWNPKVGESKAYLRIRDSSPVLQFEWINLFALFQQVVHPSGQQLLNSMKICGSQGQSSTGQIFTCNPSFSQFGFLFTAHCTKLRCKSNDLKKAPAPCEQKSVRGKG